MFLLILLACPRPAHPPVTGELETHTLHSEVVDDEYLLYVRLPPDYDPEGAHPVIFQLDPYITILPEMEVTSGWASELEAQGAIPPTVVVGVGYPEDLGGAAGRWRDYTPPDVHGDTLEVAGEGAPAFLDFLRTELSPWVEEGYAVAGPEQRAIFGHSLGGLFTSWALLQRPEEGDFVQGYVAASPSWWWDSGALFTTEEDYQASHDDLEAELLLTSGDFEGPEMTVYFDAMAERLESRDHPGLRLEVQRYPADHVGTVSPSFEAGLRFFLGEEDR